MQEKKFLKEEEKTQQPVNIQELESQVVESAMHGDKPYRKVPRMFAKPVFCFDCKTTHNLILITEPKTTSFKRVGHKKNRNRTPIVDNNGNKVYLCSSCLKKRATKGREAS